MAITPVTLTGDLATLLPGVEFEPRRILARIETNLPAGSAVVDTSEDGQVHLGTGAIAVGADGKFEVEVLPTDSPDTNPTGFQYKVTFTYTDLGARKGGQVATTGWFSLTESSDIRDIIAEQYVPATWISQATQQLEAIITGAVDEVRDEVAADVAAAQDAKADAEAAATEAEAAAALARDISNIDTTDDAVDVVLNLPGGKAQATLKTTIATDIETPGNPIHSALTGAIGASQTGLDFAPLVATETTVSGVRPIGSIGDGYVYGTHTTTGGLYRSTDGASWTQLPNLAGNPITIHDAGDGEVLVNRSGTLQKSSGWSSNPLTATFVTVATATAGASFIQSDIDVHDNIVLLGEYAVPRTPSKMIRVSTDHGSTFADVLNLDDLYPANIADTHWHAVCIDPWHAGANPRLYASHGDGPRGVYYSDDLGDTWTLLRNDWQPMPMIATENGIVVGTDANDPDGVWLIPRSDTATRELLYRIPAPHWSSALLGFGQRAHRDPKSGTIYITFRVDTLASIGKNLRGMIFATDGYRANLVYETELAAASGENVTFDAPATLADGTLLVTYVEPGGTARRLIRSHPKRGGMPVFKQNEGNAQTGRALDRSSVVIGPEAVGSGRSVLIGSDFTQTSTDGSQDFRSVLIGMTVSGGNQSVGIGHDVIADKQRAVAIGMTAKVTGSDGTALGANSIAHTSGVAVGKSATNGTGLNNVAIGLNAANTGNNSLAIGANATAGATSTAIGVSASSSHTGGVALGNSTVTTANMQLMVGARHVALQELATDPGVPGANEARLYVKDDGAGNTILCVRTTGGVKTVTMA